MMGKIQKGEGWVKGKVGKIQKRRCLVVVSEEDCAKRRILRLFPPAFAGLAAMHSAAAGFNAVRAASDTPSFVSGQVQGSTAEDNHDNHGSKRCEID